MGKVRTSVVRWATILIVLVAWMSASAFGAIKNSDCLECHADKTLVKTNANGRAIPLFVDEVKLRASAHSTNTCASCHSDLTPKHPDDNIAARPVNCRQCHERQTESYGASVHGLAVNAGRADSATCQDCHDSHEVLPVTSPASPLHFSRQAATCGACHESEARDFAASVHGKALAAGVRDAPTCTDCHSEHKIEALKGGSRMKVSEQACSRCHASERINTKYNLPADRVKTFFESYHGLAAAYGSTVAANCASCHGYHKILPSSDSDSTIHKDHLVETCGKCHPGASANFAESKVHIDAAAASSSTGGDGVGLQINWWVRRIYLILIVGVVGAMFIHNALVFVKKTRKRLYGDGENEPLPCILTPHPVEGRGSGERTLESIPTSKEQRVPVLVSLSPQWGEGQRVRGELLLDDTNAQRISSDKRRTVLRMSKSQRWQHFALGASFTILAITGFALKFPESWLARMMGSSEPFRSWTHRIAGIVLLGVGAYHIVYLLSTREGRQLVRDFFPVKKDLADVWTAVRYLTGLSKEKPKIARFGYAEKMEYWAVIWGTIIMGATGLAIWFKIDVTRFLPRWAIDVALTIHYYEAVLACLAIVVWHFYHVIFDPDVYPFNMACWDGRVSSHWQEEEHPLEKPPGKAAPLPGPVQTAQSPEEEAETKIHQTEVDRGSSPHPPQ